MKEYEIIIKSHSEQPDYENTCQAESFYEAAKIFHKDLNRGDELWGLREVADQMKKEFVPYKFHQLGPIMRWYKFMPRGHA